jgi:hypothetical protein
MKSFILALPALLALTACDRGTQSADVTTEEAEAAGNIVGNSSSSKPSSSAASEPGTEGAEPEATPSADTTNRGDEP